MSYYENEEIRKEIDAVLHENVQLFQNLGTDSSKEDYANAVLMEMANLLSVKDLDPEFIEPLLSASKPVRKPSEVVDEVAQVKFQDFDWADNMETDVKACSIDNGDDCEACGS